MREKEIKYFNKKPECIGFKIILISFLFAMGMILLSSLASLGFNASLWNIEIALMMIINSLIFNNIIGKHQYVSIFLFAGFLSLLQIIYMLSPRTNIQIVIQLRNVKKNIYMIILLFKL